MNAISGSYIVGYDFGERDTGVLVVGKQVKGQVEVINAFSGEDARAMFEMLTTNNLKGEN